MIIEGLTKRVGLGRRLTIEEGDGNIEILRDAIENLTLNDVLRVLSEASAITNIVIARHELVDGVEVERTAIGLGLETVTFNAGDAQFVMNETGFDVNVTARFAPAVESVHAVNLGQVVALLAGYAALTGATFTGDVQLPALPVNGTSAVTKAYVESIVDSLKWKRHARVASVANVNISSAPASIDGVTLSVGDRVVLKDQTEGTQNGVYTFNGAGNSLSRSSDSDTGAELANYTIPVESGTVNKDTWWTVTNDSITIGTTVIVFSKTGGIGTYTNGTGLQLGGNVFSVDTTWLNSIIATAISGKANASDVASALALKLDASKLTEWALTSYLQTITWTGIAPTDPANVTWQANRVGKEVSVMINYIATAAGSGLTTFTMPLPTGLPAPAVPTGFDGADYYVYPVFGYLYNTQTGGPLSNVPRGGIRKNGTGWDIVMTFSTSAFKAFQLSFRYFAV